MAASVSEKECSVCYCGIEAGETEKTLDCSHVFHDACIGRWISDNASCPCCRDPLFSRVVSMCYLPNESPFAGLPPSSYIGIVGDGDAFAEEWKTIIPVREEASNEYLSTTEKIAEAQELTNLGIRRVFFKTLPGTNLGSYKFGLRLPDAFLWEKGPNRCEVNKKDTTSEEVVLRTYLKDPEQMCDPVSGFPFIHPSGRPVMCREEVTIKHQLLAEPVVDLSTVSFQKIQRMKVLCPRDRIPLGGTLGIVGEGDALSGWKIVHRLTQKRGTSEWIFKAPPEKQIGDHKFCVLRNGCIEFEEGPNRAAIQEGRELYKEVRIDLSDVLFVKKRIKRQFLCKTGPQHTIKVYGKGDDVNWTDRGIKCDWKGMRDDQPGISVWEVELDSSMEEFRLAQFDESTQQEHWQAAPNYILSNWGKQDVTPLISFEVSDDNRKV